MADIRYTELDNLKPQETEELKQIVGSYAPKFDNKTRKSLLTVKAKKKHVLGTVGRFEVMLALESPDGRFYAEQSGWGLTKTTRRCAEHMKNLLDHKIRKDMLEHKPRKLRKAI